MQLMRNEIRPYAWGSRTALADLIGLPSPAPEPQAELWIGAHPNGSSWLLGEPDQSLVDVIARDPASTLGSGVWAAFGPRLPFLLKVLAASEPLSLQAHPSPEQARRGYLREEAALVPLSAPRRNYRDPFAKPELVCAVTEFHALCGFRAARKTIAVLEQLQVPQLRPYTSTLSDQPGHLGLRRLFLTFMTMPADEVRSLLGHILSACADRVARNAPHTLEYQTTLDLGHRYPTDRGVLASLLLNRVVLQPGQALYLGAGTLHAYLSGVAVEIMANSDNVLRGGLTSKHVDVAELLAVVDFGATETPITAGLQGKAGEVVYLAPAPEFRLARLDLTGGERDIGHDGPQVLLALEGQATVTSSTGRRLSIGRGQSV